MTEHDTPFSRRVTVNLTHTPQGALDATGRNQCANDAEVVASMPRGQIEEELFFFELGKYYVYEDKLEQEYAVWGLKPASPFSLAALNEADPAFADEHPNGTHWKDARGHWCFASFSRWGEGRNLHVNQHDENLWTGHWWFAGVRK